MPRSRRQYDHRLKQLVAEAGAVEQVRFLNIPKSTLQQWVKNGPPEVVTLPEFEMNVDALTKEIITLKSQIAALKAKEQLNCITKLDYLLSKKLFCPKNRPSLTATLLPLSKDL